MTTKKEGISIGKPLFQDFLPQKQRLAVSDGEEKQESGEEESFFEYLLAQLSLSRIVTRKKRRDENLRKHLLQNFQRFEFSKVRDVQFVVIIHEAEQLRALFARKFEEVHRSQIHTHQRR